MAEINSWQAIQDEVLSRIHSRVWKPGDLIPNEADLAEEFGCARATVNRALRALAESGLLDRRRKAGTRVALHPVRKATLNIPILRQEIEDRNQQYGYALISSELVKPPADIRARMGLSPKARALKIVALHLADGRPYVYEDRWVNSNAVPAIEKADLSKISANEWLVMNAPFTRGDIAFSAMNATPSLAEILGIDPGEALFVVERNTWDGDVAMTAARLVFAPGHRVHTSL